MNNSHSNRSLSFSLLPLLVSPLLGCSVSPDVGAPQKDSSTAQRQRTVSEVIEEPPVPTAPGTTPLAGAKLFVDPESLARLQANAIREESPEDAVLLDRIADQPQAVWLGSWNSDVVRTVDHLVSMAAAQGAVPVFIAYNVPYRDCGQYSQGGLSSKDEYQRWIRGIHAGIDGRAAVVVLEPDALGHFQECLSDAQKEERMDLLNDAVRVLRQNPSVAVYLDAGHARWVPAEDMAERLKLAGVEYAHGFALNTSNYVSTDENLEYGRELSLLTDGKHFIVDTSRNGAGPYEDGNHPEDSWCNPPGRKIGQPPTTRTGDPLCDAYLWLKRPGESDGTCNGGPQAGAFWKEMALELAAIDE